MDLCGEGVSADVGVGVGGVAIGVDVVVMRADVLGTGGLDAAVHGIVDVAPEVSCDTPLQIRSR